MKWIFFILILIGCKPTLKERTYEVVLGEHAEKVVHLEINDFPSFDFLTTRIDDLYCQDSVPAIQLIGNNYIKTLEIFGGCSTVCLHIKKRNLFRIHDDVIKQENEHSLDNLEQLFLQFYTNNGVDPLLSQSPQKAIVEIIYEKQQFTNLENILFRLTEAYDSLEGKGPLMVMLSSLPELPPPPPLVIKNYNPSDDKPNQ